MGIYIHGIDMPKDGCKSCAFDIYGSCLIKANMDKPYEVTHSCPLIELPPHGRLIDADVLAAKDTAEYEEAINFAIDLSTRTLFDCTHREVQKAIKNAPTIIPADPEGGVEG